MEEEIWNSIEPKHQGKIIANFDMASVDFERDLLVKIQNRSAGGYHV